MEAGDNRWLDLMGRLFMRLGPNAGEAPATPGLRDMVMGSSSYYGHSPDAGPLRGMNRMTAWGESASTRFSGAEGKLSLDGEVDTAILGADGEWGRGVLSMRAGETGRFELALRSDAMLTDTASTADTGLERRCRCLAPKGRAAVMEARSAGLTRGTLGLGSWWVMTAITAKSGCGETSRRICTASSLPFSPNLMAVPPCHTQNPRPCRWICSTT